MMDQLPSEVLLKIFKGLNSREMVKVMRVCGKWFEVIDSNKSLWRSLVLSEYIRERHSFRSILELFDRKSGSSLERVDIKWWPGMDKESNPVVEVLTRSRESLRILLLSLNGERAEFFFSEASWNFPHLVDCRITNFCAAQHVRIKARDQAPRKCAPSLKVLWVGEIQILPISTQLLANLSSLRVHFGLSSKQWRDLLEPASKSLKHLHIFIINKGETDSHLPLDFPQLEILEFLSCELNFPSWIKIPSSSTVILRGHARPGMPSVSTIWTHAASSFAGISNRCPVLINLMIDVRHAPLRKESSGNLLLEMLRQRRENVRNHFQVDGIEMIALKTLTIPFDFYEPEEIFQMRSLAEEVIDSETVPNFIELEV